MRKKETDEDKKNTKKQNKTTSEHQQRSINESTDLFVTRKGCPQSKHFEHQTERELCGVVRPGARVTRCFALRSQTTPITRTRQQ
jgi:hypothetical protein